MADKTGRILVIDDNEDILFTLKLLLKQFVEAIDTTTDPHRIPEFMQKENYDVILLDMNFTKDSISGQEGFYWLERIIDLDPTAVVVFITAYGDVERAVKAIKAGAADFVLKPWQNEKLLATVNSAIRLKRSKEEAMQLRMKKEELSSELERPFKDFIGNSRAMQQVFATIKKVAQTDASVLILGENGTGKELVARALHRQSRRKDEVFISVDLGAISETLFESELFGHVRGAFTDARKDRPGRFEIACGGTLFLDEIGNLSLPMQAKLLTAIEKQQVTRVGSNKPVPVDVRMICATNMPIHGMVGQHKFRQDLLYRINTVEIVLPPLRDRIDDIPLLADHFLKKVSAKYNKEIRSIHPDALTKLYGYTWPGNVRELQHAIERAVILCESDVLKADDFLLTCPAASQGEELQLQSFNIDDVEKNVIQKALRKHNGNISKAARELGLTRASLYRRLEKYAL